MSSNEHNAADSQSGKWLENTMPADKHSEIVQLSGARSRVTDEAGATIARQLNGPLTALMLYMNEIKQHSHQFSQAQGDRLYLQQVVDNALQQTERVCALVKQLSDSHKPCGEHYIDRATEGVRKTGMALNSGSGRKPLTKREREVLSLISEGFSNKQGALRMNISPRTFESHRAEAMRKLGARNTADLVRKALLHSA